MEVDVNGFENDLETFHSSDDVLTLLIHLGYLTYHDVSVKTTFQLTPRAPESFSFAP